MVMMIRPCRQRKIEKKEGFKLSASKVHVQSINKTRFKAPERTNLFNGYFIRV